MSLDGDVVLWSAVIIIIIIIIINYPCILLDVFYRYWYKNGCLFPDMGTVFIPIDDTDKHNGCLKVILLLLLHLILYTKSYLITL